MLVMWHHVQQTKYVRNTGQECKERSASCVHLPCLALSQRGPLLHRLLRAVWRWCNVLLGDRDDVIQEPSQQLFSFLSALRLGGIVFRLGLLWTGEIQRFSTSE